VCELAGTVFALQQGHRIRPAEQGVPLDHGTATGGARLCFEIFQYSGKDFFDGCPYPADRGLLLFDWRGRRCWAGATDLTG
jgi:hypothetical protein